MLTKKFPGTQCSFRSAIANKTDAMHTANTAYITYHTKQLQRNH